MKTKNYQEYGLESSLIRVLIQILVHLVVLFFGVSEAFATSGITYQGRLLKPDGTAVLTSVEFKLQIRTPGAEDCLLYEETLTQNLATTSGMFAISLGENPLYRTDSYSANWSMFDALSNRKAFTGFNGSDCTGVTNYTPSASDNRVFKVSFNDGTQAPGTYENLPVQAINFVPMSVESLAVGGFKASSLLRVEQGGALVNTAPLNNAQYVELLALLAGSSNQYTRDGELNGVALPTIGNNESVRWSGGAWQAFTPLVSETDPTVQAFAKSALPICGVGTVLKSDGTSLSCVPDSGGWTAVDATDTVKGIVVVPTAGGLAVAGGSLSLPDQASVTPGSYAKVTVNAKGIITAHGSLIESDIPTLSTAGKVSGSAITSGTIAGSTAINTTGNISVTGVGGKVSSTISEIRRIELMDDDVTPTPNRIEIRTPIDITVDYTMTLPGTQGLTNQILGMNNAANGMEYKSITAGSGVTINHTAGGIEIVANNSGTVTSVTGTANEITVGGTASAPVVGLGNLAVSPAGTFGSATQVPVVTIDAKGRVTAVTPTTISGTSPVGSALAQANIWVGSSGGVAAQVPVSGDVSLTDTGLTTVTSIRGNAVQSGTPSDGQVYRYDASGSPMFKPAYLNVQDIRSIANNTISVFPSACTSSQTMTWSALTDTFACSNITGVSASNITNTAAGNIAATTVQAAINELDTEKVAKSGDTMTGLLTVPSLIRTPAALPGAPAAGEIAIDSADSNKLKWYNGSAWQIVGTGSGTGDIMNGGNATGTAVSVGTTDAQNFQIETNNTAKVTVLSGGSVGIGTTSPGGLLTVEKSSNNATEMQISSLGVSGNQEAFLSLVTKSNGSWLGQATNKGWQFGARGDAYSTVAQQNDLSLSYWNGSVYSQSLSVDSLTGNVGIGVVAPMESLHLEKNQSGAVNLKLRNSNAGTDAEANFILANNVGDIGYIWTGGSAFSTNFNAQSRFMIESSINSDGIVLASSGGGTIVFNTGGPTAADEKMRLTNAGHLGIGTDTPAATLDVVGSIKSVAVSNPGVTIDFATGNLQYTSADCGASILKNMKSGATYSLVFQGVSGGVCSFTAYSDNAITPITVRTGPSNLVQTPSTHMIFSFLVMGSYVYVMSADGF